MQNTKWFGCGFGGALLALSGCYMAADGDVEQGESWQALLADGDASRIVAPAASATEPPAPRDCGGDCSALPLAFWRLDDCNDASTLLSDSAWSGPIAHPAFRAVATECVAGAGQLGVRLSHAEDVIYAPDQPDFDFDEGLTIAAFVEPNGTRRTQSLVRKRLGDDSAFVLAIENRRVSFVLRLSNGRVLGVSAPIRAGRFTHVAATYDGRQARLYLDGELAARARGAGRIARGAGPIFIGNDADGRRFDGVVDEIWLNTLAASPDAIRNLTCISVPPRVSLTPATTPPLVAGDAAHFELSIENQNSPSCGDGELFYTVQSPFGREEPPSGLVTLAPGETLTVPVDIDSSKGAYPGLYTVTAYVADQAPLGAYATAEATIEIGTGPISCDGYPPFTDVIAGGPSSLAGYYVTYVAPGLAEPSVEPTYNTDGSIASLEVTANPGIPTSAVDSYFGVDLPLACTDASAFDAVQFSIAGDLGTCTLQLELVTAEDNQVAFGGACTESICYGPLSEPLGVGTWVVPFSELSGGVPVPTADPTAIQGVQWALGAPTDGVTEPCSANFTISDVSFVTVGP